jgi:hypothetical protein
MSRKHVKTFPITRDIPHHTHVCILFYIFNGATAVSGPGPPHYRGFRSFSGTPHSVGLLWTSDIPDAETSIWQHTHSRQTDIHATGAVRTRNSSNRVAVEPLHRPRGRWHRR